jgi:hypothetical protein
MAYRDLRIATRIGGFAALNILVVVFLAWYLGIRQVSILEARAGEIQKRSADARLIERTGESLNHVYGVMAHGIISRDVRGTARDLAALERDLAALVDEIQKLANSDEERALARQLAQDLTSTPTETKLPPSSRERQRRDRAPRAGRSTQQTVASMPYGTDWWTPSASWYGRPRTR